jgi:cell division transport system permease protein
VVRKLIYFFVRALRNMRQSPFLCTAAVSTVMVALVILAFFALVVLNIEQLTRSWSREVQISAYLDQAVGSESVAGKQTQIGHFPEVEEVVFISRQQAYESFKERLGDDADLLQGMKKDFLPASFAISLKAEFRNRLGVEKVVERLRQDSQLSDLRYGQDWLEKFEAFLALLHAAGLILGGFLLFATLFIVSNTIKLTLFARRDELEVMALVGGTPGFIKTPFLLEGAIQGAVGGLLALLISYGFFQFYLKEDLSNLLIASGIGSIEFLPPAWQVALVATGTSLGLIGSFLSLRKLVRI